MGISLKREEIPNKQIFLWPHHRKKKNTHGNVLIVGVLFVSQYGGGGEGLRQYGVHVDLGDVLDLDLTARLEDLGQVAGDGVVDRLDELEKVLNLKKNEERL